MCIKKIKLHLNLGELRQIQDARLLRTGIYLAKAEVHAMSCALDPNSVRSKALFDSDPEHYEYAVVTKFANGISNGHWLANSRRLNNDIVEITRIGDACQLIGEVFG